MKITARIVAITASVIFTIATAGQAGDRDRLVDAPPPPPGFPKFQMQEIATDFKIGYAVHICDVDGDAKPDIVVVDKERVVWYQNPTWTMRTITQGKAKPDNVCLCSMDIDGDGKIDFVLGAGWKPFDTEAPGTLQWLRRKANLDLEWDLFPIPCDEPTVHRVAVGGLLGDGRPQFTMAPLMGRGATKGKQFLDGRPVRIMGYVVPDHPERADAWKPVVVNEQFHVVHNFTYRMLGSGESYPTLSLACHEGIHNITAVPAKQPPFAGTALMGDGDQALAFPGSEIAATEFNLAWKFDYATVEPWHGNSIVHYSAIQGGLKNGTHRRTVVDDKLRWGHAIKLAKLLGDDVFIIAGIRDNPDPKQGDKFTEQRGVRLYRKTDGKGDPWERFILEAGGVAVEDLQVDDLNGDGKPDIVAVGRATGNCRIYWNRGR
jgi:hypothetical protein